MDDNLIRIAHHLTTQSCFLKDLGLYHGKMGIILFFTHYAKYTEKTIYERIASDLLDDLYQEINTEVPVNFESGLCGICWGVEYLLQHGFVKGDSNDILGDIDQIIMERDVRRIQDVSVETGLTGLSYYIDLRLKPYQEDSENLPFDDVYRSEWHFRTHDLQIPASADILKTIIGEPTLNQNISEWKLGLSQGCAGYGLKLLLK